MRRWHTAPAEALPFTDTERDPNVGTFVGIDGVHQLDTEPSLLDALADDTAHTHTVDCPTVMVTTVGEHWTTHSAENACTLTTGDRVTFPAMRGDAEVTVTGTVAHAGPGSTWVRVTTEAGHTTEVRRANLTPAPQAEDNDPQAATFAELLDTITERHEDTPRDRQAAEAATTGDAFIDWQYRAAAQGDLARIVAHEAADDHERALAAADAGTHPALDMAARLVPARWQYRLAAAMLAPVAEDHDADAWRVFVPLALPGKARGVWMTGDLVIPVPGAWLVRLDHDHGPHAYRAGSLAAEAAAHAWLAEDGRPGTVAVALIGTDGHATVTEYA